MPIMLATQRYRYVGGTGTCTVRSWLLEPGGRIPAHAGLPSIIFVRILHTYCAVLYGTVENVLTRSSHCLHGLNFQIVLPCASLIGYVGGVYGNTTDMTAFLCASFLCCPRFELHASHNLYGTGTLLTPLRHFSEEQIDLVPVRYKRQKERKDQPR